jgi:signal transduction histidine kinase
MIGKRWFGILAPLLLIGAAAALLVQVILRDTGILLPGNPTLLIFLFGLSLTIFSSLIFIIREVSVTLRQQFVEQAQETAFAEHRRFLRRLDHELKNPLTALRAGLSGLEMTTLGTTQREIIATMESEVVRLSQLATNLRKLSEIDTASLEAHPINVADFVKEILDLNVERITAHNRRFEQEFTPQLADLPPLIGDQDLLLLAANNLLDNALKYTSDGDTIILRVDVAEADLIIEIRDNGKGIAEGDLPHVWEELYRGQETNTIPGKGIGLSLVRMIIERHYGSVKLASQQDQGVTVTLRLPLI